MDERQYDEQEVREIFDRASRPVGGEPSRAVGSAGGFTLAELQEIGAEAGIDPARVAEAARALDRPRSAPPPTRRLAGLPIGVSRTVRLPAGFDDAAWHRLVVDLRETFEARGRVEVHGAFREWSNGNLQALVEPVDDGYQLRLRTVKGSARQMIGMGAAMLAMALVLLVVSVLTGDADPVAGAAFLGLMGAGFAVTSAARLPGWARTRARQMDEVASRALLESGG